MISAIYQIQAKIRVRNAALAEAINIEVRLAGGEMPAGDGGANVGVLLQVPRFVNDNAIRHAMLVEAEAAVMGFRIRHYADLDCLLHIGVAAKIPRFINPDLLQ